MSSTDVVDGIADELGCGDGAASGLQKIVQANLYYLEKIRSRRNQEWCGGWYSYLLGDR